MTDEELERTLESARRAGPAWNAGRQQQLKWAVMARLDQSRRGRPLFVLAFGCFAAAVIGVVGWRSLARTPSPAGLTAIRLATGGGVGMAVPATPATSDRPLSRLADGSSIVLDGPSAILKKTVETNDEVAFQLEEGGAHFEVAPRPSRVFRVHAGPVTVQVIGTRFHVQRQAARSQISVDRGKVLVSWWGGSRELVAGEEGTFPPAYEAPNPPAPSPIAIPLAAARRATTSSSTSTSHASHRSLAARTSQHASPQTPIGRSPSVLLSKVDAASPHSASAIEGPARPAVANAGVVQERHSVGPESMFMRADRARTEGKPDLAIAHLREIVDRYPGDPHAPMAAFTVGRLLLESLGKPRQAALAFGQARALANGGPLGEDALAREVEALHAAGDSSTARQRADLYRQIFPNGPRLHTVMRFGGLRATP